MRYELYASSIECTSSLNEQHEPLLQTSPSQNSQKKPLTIPVG